MPLLDEAVTLGEYRAEVFLCAGGLFCA